MMRCVVVAIFLLFSLAACRERYGLPMEASRDNLLVVEGNILNGDTTKIRLSRTSAISERRLIPESGASLQIEGEDNSLYPLSESDSGLYKSNFLTLNSAISRIQSFEVSTRQCADCRVRGVNRKPDFWP